MKIEELGTLLVEGCREDTAATEALMIMLDEIGQKWTDGEIPDQDLSAEAAIGEAVLLFVRLALKEAEEEEPADFIISDFEDPSIDQVFCDRRNRSKSGDYRF